MVRRCFLAPGQLLANLGAISHLPCSIVQGRYDVICPPHTAWAVHQNWPGSKLVWVNKAGHSSSEPEIAEALVSETQRLVQCVRANGASPPPSIHS